MFECYPSVHCTQNFCRWRWWGLLSFRVVHSVSVFSRCMLSKAFLKSMKSMHSGAFHSVLCSMMLRSENIWSMHPLPLRNPVYSWRRLTSIASYILLSKTLQKILLGIDNNVIPLQLSQFWRSPFFGIFTIRPLFQSLGISLAVHISLKRPVKTCPAVMTSVFSSSMEILSILGDFPVFICFIAWVTSCSFGTPVAISRSSLGAGGSAVIVGASVMRTSVKCSAHRLASFCG